MPMTLRGAQVAFLLVTLASIAGALFRVATAPDRIRERRELAYNTCVSNGGQWQVERGAEVCRKVGEAVLPTPPPPAPDLRLK